MRQLRIPSEASSARQAVELARVWAIDGAQHVSLRADAWPDPAAWGLMLVDLARHIANSYEQSGSMSSGDALKRIRNAFDVEWSTPSDEPTGARLTE